MLRRLIPFPGRGGPASLRIASVAGRGSEGQTADVVPQVAGRQAAAIIAEAASILDEEMARGVLAARGEARELVSPGEAADATQRAIASVARPGG